MQFIASISSAHFNEHLGYIGKSESVSDIIYCFAFVLWTFFSLQFRRFSFCINFDFFKGKILFAFFTFLSFQTLMFGDKIHFLHLVVKKGKKKFNIFKVETSITEKNTKLLTFHICVNRKYAELLNSCFKFRFEILFQT